MNEWISVKDRLPPEGRTVLVYEEACLYTAFWVNLRKTKKAKPKVYWSYQCDCETDPKQPNAAPEFWCELPEPPKDA